MKKFEIQSHTADIRLWLKASSLEELFKVAIEGMNKIMEADFSADAETIKQEIKLSATDVTALLVDFMSEVLTRSHEESAVFEVANIRLDGLSVAASIKGKPVKNFGVDVKAVTYHEAEVKKNTKGNWETVVIFDI